MRHPAKMPEVTADRRLMDNRPAGRSLLGNGPTIFAAIVVYLAVSATATAQDGWSLKKLNPFAKDNSTKSRATATVTDSDPLFSMPKFKAPSFKMPSLKMPTFSKPKTRAARNEPSGLQKFNRSTKSFFSKTSAALQPWKKNTRKPTRTAVSKEKKSSPFGWLSPFPKEQESRQAQTINEFLKLPRPDRR